MGGAAHEYHGEKTLKDTITYGRGSRGLVTFWAASLANCQLVCSACYYVTSTFFCLLMHLIVSPDMERVSVMRLAIYVCHPHYNVKMWSVVKAQPFSIKVHMYKGLGPCSRRTVSTGA